MRLLTGLHYPEARDVVMHGRHEFYDGSVPSRVDEEQTLEEVVRATVAAHLDERSPADTWVVAALLEARGGSWLSVYGETIELGLIDGRRVLTGEPDWDHVEVGTAADLELWWTGLWPGCPDPLVVADALDDLTRSGQPFEGRRVCSCDQVVPQCSACGAWVAPVIYGMPDGRLRAMAAFGYVEIGGCVVEENQPRWRCTRCETAVETPA